MTLTNNSTNMLALLDAMRSGFEAQAVSGREALDAVRSIPVGDYGEIMDTITRAVDRRMAAHAYLADVISQAKIDDPVTGHVTPAEFAKVCASVARIVANVPPIEADDAPVQVKAAAPATVPTQTLPPVEPVAAPVVASNSGALDTQYDSRVKFLQHAATTSEFLASLAKQLDAKGDLSMSQWTCVDKAMAEAATPGIDASKVHSAFTAAAATLKHPKVLIGDVLVKPAKKYPGVLYLTRGETYLGKIDNAGVFHAKACDADTLAELRALFDDFTGAAAKHGHKTKHCGFCSRELHDKRSTDVGYGPVCAANYGLPWG